MNSTRIHNLLLRLAPAFIFITFGIWEVKEPGFWTGFIPPFAHGFMDLKQMVMIHGVILVILGIGFLIGKGLRYIALVASLILASIVYSIWLQQGFSDIFIRDVAILIFTASLIFF